MELSEIKGIGPVTEKKLNELGIFSAEDLVEKIPKSYIDMTKFTMPHETADGEFCFFKGVFTKIGKPYKNGKTEILKARVLCEGEEIYLVWFNRNYLSKNLIIGEKYYIFGKLKIEKNHIFLYNPNCEKFNENQDFFEMRPIYITKGLIPQKTYRGFVADAIKKCYPESVISKETALKMGLTDLRNAYLKLHFPKTESDLKQKERISLEKTVRRICAFKIAQNRQLLLKNRHYDVKTDVSPLYEKLPFKLNPSQISAVEKLKQMLASKEKANAVLCGDVGRGKTPEALFMIYFVVKNGYRALLMAPTEILAEQHYNFMKNVFFQLGINVCFLSGSQKNSEKNSTKNLIKSGFFDVIIGTHSLIGLDDIPGLGFVCMDEQQRFGVAQRTGLILKGETPDVLTLTATPIPRSMLLAIYGELEYITLEKRFSNNVKTVFVPHEKRNGMWNYLKKICNEGEQAYVIAPKIYDAEGIEIESVESLQNELSEYFSSDELGVLHGKTKQQEKDKILKLFRDGILKVLVSTSVVEVGIDVPNASVIVITDAERFGLSSLHQLRGRVGRKGQKSYCFLYSDKPPTERLKIMCECSDGFEIAERDFELRGGGDIFGLDQSGNGTLEGLNVKILSDAKKISELIDVKKIERKLIKEIGEFSLTEVSLN